MNVVVVNEQDEVLGYKSRDDRNQTDIIRVAGIWLVNSKGDALIAQRALDKIHDPAKWAISAAGTVEEGETYLSNILKEVEEELGIVLTGETLITGPKKYINTDHRYFAQLYFAASDAPAEGMAIQKEEVEAVRWVSIAEIEEWLKKSPTDFILSFESYFDDLKNYLANNRAQSV